VVASPDGWVYYSDWWNWGAPLAGTPRIGSYLVERSADGGNSWESAPVTTLDGVVGGVDRQWLLAGEEGFVGLFYAYFHGPQNAVRQLGDLQGRADTIMSLQVVRSEDHGASWGNPVTAVPPVSGLAYQIAHPARLPDGALALPFGEVTSTSVTTDDFRNPSRVRVTLSEDQGRTWEPRTVAEVPEGFDNLWAVQGATDDAGNLVVAWAARTGERMTLFLSESADRGTTWTEPQALRAEGLNFLPWVAARGDGQVAVAWYGGNATGEPEEAGEDARWYAFVAERQGRGQPFRIGTVGEEPVKQGPMCPKGAACAANRELLDYVSLAYGPDGRLHMAFARSREVDGAKAGLVHYAGSAP
jgi:hypothetical protein